MILEVFLTGRTADSFRVQLHPHPQPQHILTLPPCSEKEFRILRAYHITSSTLEETPGQHGS
jgi:hypothetical protein